MEILNKKSTEIANAKFKGRPHVSFASKEKIYFPAAAVKAFGLTPGRFVQFVCDLERLYFYVNEDSEGFSITKGGQTEAGPASKVYSLSAISTLLKRYLAIKKGKKFPLKYSHTKVNDCQLIEIMIHSKV